MIIGYNENLENQKDLSHYFRFECSILAMA